MSAADHSNPKKRSLRFRISIRSSLIVVGIAAFGMFWFRSHQESAERQAAVVNRLRSQEALFFYDYAYAEWKKVDSPRREIYSLGFGEPYEPRHSVPDWLIRLLGEDFFCGVAYVDVPDDDAALLASVFELPDLEYIGFSKIDPAGLAAIRNVRSLRRVRVFDTVTPVHVRHIADSAAEEVIFCGDICNGQLRELSRSDSIRHVYSRSDEIQNSFDDQGVEALCDLKALESLTIISEQVTARGIACLETLPNLTYLEIKAPNASGGIAKAVAGKRLKHLEILDTRIDLIDLTAIRESDSVEYLRIRSNSLCALDKQKLIATVADMKRLRTLVISGEPLALDEIRSLLGMPSLTSLACETKIASTELQRLASQHPTKLIRRLELDPSISENELTFETFGEDL